MSKQTKNEKTNNSPSKKEQRNPAVEMEMFMNEQKPLFEERLKVVIAIILVILFLLLFVGIAWYFLTQVDTTLVNNMNGSSSSAVASISNYTFV